MLLLETRGEGIGGRRGEGDAAAGDCSATGAPPLAKGSASGGGRGRGLFRFSSSMPALLHGG